MDKEFHYYITGIVAKRAGFSDEDACVIAHSSQLVDDNDILRTIEDGSDSKYEVYISQTMDILQPKDDLMRIYPIFHFLPGDPAAPSVRRSDGKMHILMTTPGCGLACKVIQAAREDTGPCRLHRLGVAAHAFADTWAHQNFIGWNDSINGVQGNMLPNIGHADLMHHPDWVGHRWDDSRVIMNQVNNNLRFLDAAKRLFQEFCVCTKADANTLWPVLEKNLLKAMGPVFSGEKLQGQDDRLEAYYRLFKMPEYNQNDWFNKAVKTEVRGLPDNFLSSLTIFEDECKWKKGWQTSNWYKFQEAVKAHQALCMVELAPIFQQMNVNLHDH
jgi:hypothetical protein